MKSKDIQLLAEAYKQVKLKRPTNLNKNVYVRSEMVQKILDNDKLRLQFKAMKDANRLYVQRYVQDYKFFYDPDDNEVFDLLWDAGLMKTYSPTSGVGKY